MLVNSFCDDPQAHCAALRLECLLGDVTTRECGDTAFGALIRRTRVPDTHSAVRPSNQVPHRGRAVSRDPACVRARSTKANFDLGHRLFHLGQFYLGQVRLRPDQKFGAKFYLGQVQLRPILACPLTIQNVKIEKEKKKETKGRDNQYSPCFCEGVAFTQTRLMSAFRLQQTFM